MQTDQHLEVDLRELSSSTPTVARDLAAEIMATPHHYSKAAVEWARTAIEAVQVA